MPRPSNPDKLDELQGKLRIDQHNLEDECRMHPECLYETSKQLAYLLSKRDEAKQNMKEVEARVDAEVRHDAEVSGERVTEKWVESQKLLHRDVLAAKDQLFALERDYGAWLALKEAFQARGYAIRDLIQLYISNYYGSEMERSGSGNLRMAQTNAARREQVRPRNRIHAE